MLDRRPIVQMVRESLQQVEMKSSKLHHRHGWTARNR